MAKRQNEEDRDQVNEEEEDLEQITRDPKKEAKELKEKYKNTLWRKKI